MPTNHMKNTPALIFTAALLTMFSPQCKKSSGGHSQPKNPTLFHMDVTIHETVGQSQPPQMCIGFFQLASDPGQLVFAATRGIYELNGAQGFRVVGVRKDSTVNWIKSYALPSSYFIQYCSSATIDPQDNIWIGGHLFATDTSYGMPFLVKLDKNGNLLWSKALSDSAHYSRGLSIKALRNGDVAFLTGDGINLQLFRIAGDGTVKWSKSISGGITLAFEPSTDLYQSTYFNSHMIVEASDGSIVVAGNSNFFVQGRDCLIKLTGAGDLVFAKTYTWPSPIPEFPPQIQITENDEIVYAGQKNPNFSGVTILPYLFITSPDGDVLAASSYPSTQPAAWTRLNELNYFQHKIYLSTAGDYEINTFTYDQSLNLLSGIKTLGTNGFPTDYGGMSLYDSTTGSLYHILNIAGMTADGNGFQFLKTDAKGTSCHQYNDAPIALAMTPATLTAQSVTPQIVDGTQTFSQNVVWASMPVSITSSQLACSQ
jgi:hypothetical protein